MHTLANISGFFGTIWWTILVFICGTLIGAPLWTWVKTFFPWNKNK